jgi:hypothetical protein
MIKSGVESWKVGRTVKITLLMTVHSTSHQTVTDEQEEIVNIQYTPHHTKQ